MSESAKLNVVFEANVPVNNDTIFECSICNKETTLKNAVVSVTEGGFNGKHNNVIMQVQLICQNCAAEHAKNEGY
jgi:hypothetical protein